VGSATHSPSAETDPPLSESPPRPVAAGRTEALSAWIRDLAPSTFQARLTLGFVAVVALTLFLVSALIINRVDDFLAQQQQVDLQARALNVAQYVVILAESTSIESPVSPDNVVAPGVELSLVRAAQQKILTDQLAHADIRIRLGLDVGGQFIPAANGSFGATVRTPPPGQTREAIATKPFRYPVLGADPPYFVEVTLANPYTFRATTLANITGMFVPIGGVAFAFALLLAAVLARRFTTPLRRLTEASRGLAEGDLARRVPANHVQVGSSELAELALQFNTMAARLEESVEIIRTDRDRGRDFLADVSHELRTPIAALRTFNELLVEGAADDPERRAEFLESSRQQLERLDWLALNLLELSKLDSGLVLLDLRPDDLRVAVESAVQQSSAAAAKRGIALEVSVPDAPIRIRHDPLRVGQVVANLVGNAIKFTEKGGRIDVSVRAMRSGARIEVRDSGVGIDPVELPHIFERFFRGSRANEARGSGSGLGLAIVRSIVDMHGGTVTVETKLGAGSTFTVALPRDPRAGSASSDGARRRGRSTSEESASPASPALVPGAARTIATVRPAPSTEPAMPADVADSSSTERSALNQGAST
jgi:signal transduction histidine kinase